MFEDLKYQPSRKTLEKAIKEFRELLKDSRDEIDILKQNYDEVKQDAGKFAEHIKNLHDRINENDLQDDFADLEVPE